MCGIVGVFSSEGRLPDPLLFVRSVDKLKRRGPDDSGTWSGPQIRLGHRRLAVVDLTSAAHQPMQSHDGRYVIVFNGEIYNHAQLRVELAPEGGWRSSSDTETLLEAYRKWGTDCLQRLNGMFAFAIWDRLEQRLFLARDRMGVKPLYYSHENGLFVFGSRPGALVPMLSSSAREPSSEALRLYLELGYIPAPLSYYHGVRKLHPGHWVLVDERGVTVRRYWDFRHIQPDPSWRLRSEDDLAAELDELVRDSVRLRLMSDVPFGALLSGGVDSAIVVAAMKSCGVANPKAFTISFKEQAYDEGPEASAAARALGVEHVVETLSVSDLLALLPLYVEEFDEPFADSSAFPTMAVSRLARQHVTVALTGDAGDELFGGYHYYTLAESISRAMTYPPAGRELVRMALQALPSHRAKLLAGVLRTNGRVEAFHFLRSFAKDFACLLQPEALQGTDSSRQRFEEFAGSFAMDLSAAEIGMRLDMGFMLPNGYLQKVDLASMAFSLEARCPLTDYRLVEWSMRLPLQFKLRGGQTKYLLRKALRRHLPAEQVYRKKRGFGMPIAQWLRGPLRSWADEILHEPSVLSRVPLDRARVSQLFKMHTSGAREAHPLLWAVLMLLCYVARHDSSVGLPDLPLQQAA
jgi:asparagine synthase (glutamine-hydrolysing)